MQEWKENKLKGYMTVKGDDFDAEHEFEELERLLKEREYEEEKKQDEEAPLHGQLYVMTWEVGNSRSNRKKHRPMMWQSEAHTMATK